MAKRKSKKKVSSKVKDSTNRYSKIHMAKAEQVERDKWSEEDIRRAALIILDAEKNKSLLVKILDEIIHWIILLVILLGNVLIAGFMVIISGLVSPAFFYIILILFAVSFGLLIEFPLRDIKKLDKTKHFLSRLMLPVLAFVNIYILVGMRNALEYFLGREVELNAYSAGIVYGIFFLMPHFVGMLRRKKGG